MTRRIFTHAFPFLNSLDAPAVDISASDDTLQMDEESFRAFYDQTSRGLWTYIARVTSDTQAADDLLQESYYRLLRSAVAFESDDHRRHYLFRIATNLVRDRFRHQRRNHVQPSVENEEDIAARGDLAQQTQQRTDLRRAMAQLTRRERELVWMAYGRGSSHREIASSLGLKTSSIKPLLFRARQKLARLLRP